MQKSGVDIRNNKKLDKLHQIIRSLIESEKETNDVTYNKTRPYQSYERIRFEGLRWSVEKRIKEYGLSRFFNPDSAVLDIGSNFGFFVCEFAIHCRVAHGVEPTPELIQISEATANYLSISEKVQFFDTFFENFDAPISYDTIFSLAAFYTQDGRERSEALDYFGKIDALLNLGGHVFYESTSYTKNEDDPHYLAMQSSFEAMKNLFDLDLVDTWETPSGSEGYFRGFCVAHKKA